VMFSFESFLYNLPGMCLQIFYHAEYLSFLRLKRENKVWQCRLSVLPTPSYFDASPLPYKMKYSLYCFSVV